MTAPDGDSRPPPDRPLLLVVDDEPLNNRLTVMALKDQYALLTATNGPDALRLMKEHLPDLVLLDVMMPEIDGLTVFREARADEELADIPIVFVTAMTSTAGQSSALLLSAADYLIKPINLAHLRLLVRNLLRSKSQRDEMRTMKLDLAARTVELARALERVRQLEAVIENGVATAT